MLADHQKTVNTLMAHEEMTQDADIKAFISKTLLVVPQQLDIAHQEANMKV